MPRTKPFYTARINKELQARLDDKKESERFPGKLNIYIEWVLQRYVDGKIAEATAQAPQEAPKKPGVIPAGKAKEITGRASKTGNQG